MHSIDRLPTRQGGFGLFNIRERLKLMGGSIDMVSEFGSGTTMILDLTLGIADPAILPPLEQRVDPRAAAVAALPPAPEPAPQHEPGTPLVLVVDDHTTNRMLLVSQVTALGYAVESASNGAQALELWKTGRFSLVLTDFDRDRWFTAPEAVGYGLVDRVLRGPLPSVNGL